MADGASLAEGSAPISGPDGYVEHVSPHGFDETLARLEHAIEHAGLTIFARIDHSGAARDVGLTMPPTIVLIYGNPRGGTPIMLAAPRAALDLPLRILVREGGDGRVLVGFHPIVVVMLAAGVTEELAMRLVPAQAKLVEAALA